MALLKDYFNGQFNVTIPNCYWKIKIENGIIGGKTKLHVRMDCYVNKSVADTNMGEYCEFDFEFVPQLDSGTNFIAQAYQYAKTLPEFIGAADV